METRRICKQCQRPLPGTAPAGLCPQCLTKNAPGAETPAPNSSQIAGWSVRRPQIFAALVSGGLLAAVWLGYGLWTEHLFVAWEGAHPAELRPASSWAMDQESSLVLTILLFWLMRGLEDLLTKRRRAQAPTGGTLPRRVLTAFALAGLAGVILSIYLGSAGIETWHWANHALLFAQRHKELAVGPTAKKNISRPGGLPWQPAYWRPRCPHGLALRLP